MRWLPAAFSKQIPDFLAVAQKEGIEPRIAQAEDFARRNRVLLLRHIASQTEIDISLGVLPFEYEMVDRSQVHRIDDQLEIHLPTPEDLIIMKAIAHRPKDLLDIQGVIRNYPHLDRDRIQNWVTQFADLLEGQRGLGGTAGGVHPSSSPLSAPATNNTGPPPAMSQYPPTMIAGPKMARQHIVRPLRQIR